MYLNIIQLAESFGVDEQVIEGWVHTENLPCIHDRGRLLFDRPQVVAWAAERGLAAKAGFLAQDQDAPRSTSRLESMLRAGGIWRNVTAATLPSVLEKIVTALPGCTPAVSKLLAGRVHATDGITWAPVGGGLALPHLRAPVALGRDSGILALIFMSEPAPLAEPPMDGVPVTRMFFFIASSPRAHLELLAQLGGALTRGPLGRPVDEGAPDDAIFAAAAAAGTTGIGGRA